MILSNAKKRGDEMITLCFLGKESFTLRIAGTYDDVEKDILGLHQVSFFPSDL